VELLFGLDNDPFFLEGDQQFVARVTSSSPDAESSESSTSSESESEASTSGKLVRTDVHTLIRYLVCYGLFSGAPLASSVTVGSIRINQTNNPMQARLQPSRADARAVIEGNASLRDTFHRVKLPQDDDLFIGSPE
jgi:hypothetical protein